jgi:hypothetical protein
MATAALNIDYSRGFSVGRVFARALGAIGRNPLVTVGIAFLLGGLPSLGFNLLMRNSLAGNPKSPSAEMVLGIGVTVIFAWLVSMAIGVIVQAALTRATVADSDGRRAGMGECVMAGVRVLLPLFGLFLLWALGVGLGMLLLIIPGVILLLMWSVSVPSLVEERQGVFASFARSRALTKGERWKILGVLIVLVVSFWLLSVVLGVAGVSSIKYSGQAGAAPANLTNTVMLLSLIPSTLFSLAWGTIQAALYVELRNAKDGGSVDHLQDVFA